MHENLVANNKKQTYRSTKVDWHEGMGGQEKVIKPNNGGEVLEHVTIPCDQPAESKHLTHFGSVGERVYNLNDTCNEIFAYLPKQLRVLTGGLKSK